LQAGDLDDSLRHRIAEISYDFGKFQPLLPSSLIHLVTASGPFVSSRTIDPLLYPFKGFKAPSEPFTAGL
jgi:hypothetical protein